MLGLSSERYAYNIMVVVSPFRKWVRRPIMYLGYVSFLVMSVVVCRSVSLIVEVAVMCHCRCLVMMALKERQRVHARVKISKKTF
jgi:hypothetical protein